MTYIGFDHHKKWTQAAAIDDQGKIIREMRVLNDSSSLKGFLKGLPKPLKGVIEAGPTWGLDLRHSDGAWTEDERSQSKCSAGHWTAPH
jgi:hypothetical protein